MDASPIQNRHAFIARANRRLAYEIQKIAKKGNFVEQIMSCMQFDHLMHARVLRVGCGWIPPTQVYLCNSYFIYILYSFYAARCCYGLLPGNKLSTICIS